MTGIVSLLPYVPSMQLPQLLPYSNEVEAQIGADIQALGLTAFAVTGAIRATATPAVVAEDLGLSGRGAANNSAGATGGNIATLVEGEAAATKAKWVDENAGMSKTARDYNDSATGARSNPETQKGQAPGLERKLEDGSTRLVKFDGIDGDVLVDRKISVVTTDKAKDQALRQSEALNQNGLMGRWEVPTEAQAARATKMFNDLGIANIQVKVVKP